MRRVWLSVTLVCRMGRRTGSLAYGDYVSNVLEKELLNFPSKYGDKAAAVGAGSSGD